MPMQVQACKSWSMLMFTTEDDTSTDVKEPVGEPITEPSEASASPIFARRSPPSARGEEKEHEARELEEADTPVQWLSSSVT